MSPNEYQAEALRTAFGMNRALPMELNGVLGLAGESGECVDLMKKHLFIGPFNMASMLKFYHRLRLEKKLEILLKL